MDKKTPAGGGFSSPWLEARGLQAADGERWHSCECGTELDRDHNAALNILALGRRVQAAQAS